MPVQAPEPPPGTSLAQVRCPKGHRQWVITANEDPREVNHLICPECGIRYTLVMPHVITKRRGAGKPPVNHGQERDGEYGRDLERDAYPKSSRPVRNAKRQTHHRAHH